MILFQKIARTVSLILIPTFFNLVSFIYITFKFENDSANQLYSILLALIFGSIIPIAIFIKFRQKGAIKDIDATVRSERNLPYLIAFALCINAMVISMFLNLHPYLVILWIIYAVVSVMIYVINIYWKISAHAIGAAIPLGILIFTQSSLAFLFLPLGILVGWARIELRVHSLSQVLAGFVLGLFLTIFQFYLLTTIYNHVL